MHSAFAFLLDAMAQVSPIYFALYSNILISDYQQGRRRWVAEDMLITKGRERNVRGAEFLVSSSPNHTSLIFAHYWLGDYLSSEQKSSH